MLNQDGIEVLDTVPIMEYTKVSYAVSILGIIVMVLTFVFWIKKYKGHYSVTMSQCISLLGGLLLGLVIFVCSLMHTSVFYTETGKYTYTCVIEDEVSMKDIYSNFEIVEAKGKIYTLKDK